MENSKIANDNYGNKAPRTSSKSNKTFNRPFVYNFTPKALYDDSQSMMSNGSTTISTTSESLSPHPYPHHQSHQSISSSSTVLSISSQERLPNYTLPCRTWLQTGTCLYEERCVYLHDPRIGK